MKTSFIFKAAILTLGALAIAACTYRGKENEPGHGWGEAAFHLEVVSVSESEATIKEWADGYDGAPFYGFATSDVTSKTEAMISAEMKSITASWGILKTGTPDPVKVSGLRRGYAPYRYILFGLTPDGRTYGTPAEVIFRTAGDYQTGKITVTYDGIKSKKLTFTVNGADGPYDYVLMTQAQADEYGSIKELLSDNMTPVRKAQTGDGSFTVKSPGSGDYVLYAFGVEDELIDGAYNPTLQFGRVKFTVE